MNAHYEEPLVDKEGFTCPHCNAFSAMRWDWLRTQYDSVPFKIATCHMCKEYSIWRTRYSDNGDFFFGEIVSPNIVTAPLPNPDIPTSCRDDYLEAREIANKSPRGAAAILRLCIQKLCKELGAKGKNINDDISSLVSQGLPRRIQQALDVVRVIGNNAVHPGEISVEDQPETVHALFGLINLIIDNQITQPKQVSELFDSLPSEAKKAVEKRDSKA